MDIDALTRELQVRSRERARLLSITSRPPSNLASSVDIVSPPTSNATNHDDLDTRSDVDSVANSSEAEEPHAPSVSVASTSKSAYYTAMSGSFISDTNSVTRSWIVQSTSSASGDAEIERSRSPTASVVSSGKGHNSGTSSVTGDEEGERLMVSGPCPFFIDIRKPKF